MIATSNNPRYLAYCAAHGLTYEQMRDRDREQFPGGRNAGFIIWIGQQWQAFDVLTGRVKDHGRSNDEHAAFDEWLDAKYPAPEVC